MKKFIIVFFFLPLTFGMSIQLNAQNKKWTLQECIAYAIENNITVKQSALDVENSDIIMEKV